MPNQQIESTVVLSAGEEQEADQDSSLENTTGGVGANRSFFNKNKRIEMSFSNGLN